eukprot:785837_1
MAIAYDTSNQIFWLIGGYSGSFNKGLYSLTNDRDVFLNNSLNISIYGEGQYYSMDDQYQFLYMIHAPYGSSLNRFNIETTAIQTNYATIPIAVTVYGCLAFIAMDDGYLVIIGGLGDGITDVQILNLASRVWMSGVPSMEYARSSASCAAVNGNIYAIGGYQARDVYLDSVEVLSIGDDMRDITDNEWSVMGHLSRGMCCSRAVVYGYAIYIVGGSYYDTNDEYMNQIHMIDALTNEIALFGYMDAAFDDTAAIMIDNVLYSFGGENGTMLDSWRYLSVPITDCDGKGRIAHINWNNISEQLPYYDYEININDYQQRAEIDINLEYLGYSYDHKTTGRYYLMDESLTWNEGQARCQQFGSNLATITSEVENSEAYNLCMSATAYAQPEGLHLGCFFGLNDLEIANTWVYPDNTNVNYTDWDTPSHDEHCGRISIDIVQTNGSWYDDSCHSKRPVLCNQINTGYGTSYIISFSELNINQIYNNSNPCVNRVRSSFEDTSFHEWWTYSNYPFIKSHVGTNRYLAYPPPGPLWTLRNGNSSCTRITYNGEFSYDDFYDCANNDPHNSIIITSDDAYINITATLYVNIVSPSSIANVSATYYSYQLINESFTMSFTNISVLTQSPSSSPTSVSPTLTPSISPTSSCFDYNNETSADGNDEIRQFDDKHITNIENYFMKDAVVLEFNSSHDNYQHK